MTAATTLGYEQQAKANEAALNLVFHSARTHSAWLPKPVPERLLRAVYDIAKWGPTSANSSPARFVFLWSEGAKARLLPALMSGNVEQTRTAPVVAIIAYDLEFYEKLPKLFPHGDARSWFAGNLRIWFPDKQLTAPATSKLYPPEARCTLVWDPSINRSTAFVTQAAHLVGRTPEEAIYFEERLKYHHTRTMRVGVLTPP